MTIFSWHLLSSSFKTAAATAAFCFFVSASSYAAFVEGSITIKDEKGDLKADRSGVIVFLDELESPAPPMPMKNAVMSQKNKRFLPELLPVTVGTTVDFPNDDNIFHNVFSLSRAKPLDLGIYGQGVSKSVTFDKPGLVKVYCNIHPNMVGYILVLSNPYFAVTDKQGRFKISDVPLGAAVVRSWYSKTRTQPEKKLQVTEKGIQDLELNFVENIEFEIQEQAISVKHKNKLGQDYSAAY